MTLVASPTPQRPIHLPLGELEQLGLAAITKLAASREQEDRLNAIVAELVAICTAMPSRKRFVDCAKVLSICLRKLFAAREAGQADKVINFEGAVGHFLPFVRQDAFAAMVWEREQAAP